MIARPVLPGDERSVGMGVEGVGEGVDPEIIGKHRGFKVA